MADLTITAASVAPGTGAKIDRRYNAGATITAGQLVYLDTTTETLLLADANASALTAVLHGVALHGASSGQPLAVLTDGPITIGATVTLGHVYALSATAGGIAAVADLATGHYTSLLGVATSASVIDVAIHVSGAVRA